MEWKTICQSIWMNLIWVKLRTIHTISHCLLNICIHIDVYVCACVYVRMLMYITCTHVRVSVHTWIYKDTSVYVYITCINM